MTKLVAPGRVRVALAVVLAHISSDVARAQIEVPTRPGMHYENGVRAFFAGRSSQAELHLSQAIAENPGDPLPYYFRAMSLLRLGRTDQARGDMIIGASVEAQAGNRLAIGRALERVQGSNRLLLEQYRRQARADLARSGESVAVGWPAVQNTTYAEDAAVLRQRVLVPLERVGSASAPTSGARSGGAAIGPQREDPFRDDVEERQAAPTAPSTNTEQPSAIAPSKAEPAASGVEAVPEADGNPFGNL